MAVSFVLSLWGEGVCVAFSLETSMLPGRWSVKWNDQVICKLRSNTLLNNFTSVSIVVFLTYRIAIMKYFFINFYFF